MSYVDFVQSTAAHTTRFFKKACCVPSRFWVLWPTVLYITVARFLFCGAELLICLGFWGFLTRHPKMKERMTCMTRMSFLGQDAPFIFFLNDMNWCSCDLTECSYCSTGPEKFWTCWEKCEEWEKCIEHHRSSKELLQRCEGKVIETDVFFFFITPCFSVFFVPFSRFVFLCYVLRFTCCRFSSSQLGPSIWCSRPTWGPTRTAPPRAPWHIFDLGNI